MCLKLVSKLTKHAGEQSFCSIYAFPFPLFCFSFLISCCLYLFFIVTAGCFHRVFTVHGSKDETIPVEDAFKFSKILPNHKLHIIEGANHVYTHHQAELASVVVNYLKQALVEDKATDTAASPGICMMHPFSAWLS